MPVGCQVFERPRALIARLPLRRHLGRYHLGLPALLGSQYSGDSEPGQRRPSSSAYPIHQAVASRFAPADAQIPETGILRTKNACTFVEYTPWLYTPQRDVVLRMRLRDIFATNLRRARNAAALSQEALADLAEIDRSYVSDLETAKFAASLDMVESLADALGIPAATLLADSNKP